MQPAADMNTPESASAPTCHVRLRSRQSLTLAYAQVRLVAPG
jgi:hypothetical protein